MSTQDRINELEAALATIERKLNAGLTATTNDGISATIDLNFLRQRKSELERELERCRAQLDGRSSAGTMFRPINLPW